MTVGESSRKSRRVHESQCELREPVGVIRVRASARKSVRVLESR